MLFVRSLVSADNLSNTAGSVVALFSIAVSSWVLGTFPGWHKKTDEAGDERDVRPFPSRTNAYGALIALAFSAALAFVSMLWQHTAAVGAATTAQAFGNGNIDSRVGVTATALRWISFVLLMLSVLPLRSLIRYNDLVATLTDDSDDDWGSFQQTISRTKFPMVFEMLPSAPRLKTVFLCMT